MFSVWYTVHGKLLLAGILPSVVMQLSTKLTFCTNKYKGYKIINTKKMHTNTNTIHNFLHLNLYNHVIFFKFIIYQIY